MAEVFRALGAAFRSMVHPRMLALAVWPMLVALAVWTGLAWIFWDDWSHWLSSVLTGTDAGRWLSQRNLDRLAHYSALLLIVLALAPLVLITAVLIAALLAMPVVVNFVAARRFPTLERRRGGTFADSLLNALAAVLGFAVLWIVTLPLWLTGFLAPVIALLLSAHLNQRLFRFDALSDHASAEELRTIIATSRGGLYALGLLLALLYYVPLLNLLVPILSGLAYTHFGLARLADLRARAPQSR